MFKKYKLLWITKSGLLRGIASNFFSKNLKCSQRRAKKGVVFARSGVQRSDEATCLAGRQVHGVILDRFASSRRRTAFGCSSTNFLSENSSLRALAKQSTSFSGFIAPNFLPKKSEVHFVRKDNENDKFLKEICHCECNEAIHVVRAGRLREKRSATKRPACRQGRSTSVISDKQFIMDCFATLAKTDEMFVIMSFSEVIHVRRRLLHLRFAKTDEMFVIASVTNFVRKDGWVRFVRAISYWL